MKIKKHVLALGIVAGLAGLSGTALGSHSSVDANVHAGWWLAKKVAEANDLDDDTADGVQAFLQALGATAGAGTGALIGAKIGSLGGPIGAGIGAGVGAL